MNLIKLRAYFNANCLKLILTKLYTLTTWNMCNRTSILRKKSYQLLKLFLETKKVQSMLLQLTETRTAYQYLRTARIAQCIPLIMHVAHYQHNPLQCFRELCYCFW